TKYYKLNGRLPASYFDIQERPDIICQKLPKSYKDLPDDLRLYFPWNNDNRPNYNSLGDVVRMLRNQFYFRRLPSHWFFHKKQLPRDPKSLGEISDQFNFPV